MKTQKEMKDLVRNWNSLVEFDVSGTIMCVPAYIIHRYKGSKLDKYFSKSHQDDDKKWFTNDGKCERIYLERNPKFFRLMISFIRSEGKLDLSLLKKNEVDYKLFEAELEFLEIKKDCDFSKFPIPDQFDTIVTSQPSPNAF